MAGGRRPARSRRRSETQALAGSQPQHPGQPDVYFDGHQEIPFAVLKHFTDLVAASIEAQAT
jgi:hypothetical protein